MKWFSLYQIIKTVTYLCVYIEVLGKEMLLLYYPSTANLRRIVSEDSVSEVPANPELS